MKRILVLLATMAAAVLLAGAVALAASLRNSETILIRDSVTPLPQLRPTPRRLRLAASQKAALSRT
jgi:hypothetical protein